MQPTGLRRAENKLVSRLHLFAYGMKEPQLVDVKLLVELNVRPPDPPIVRQLDRKIAAMLPCVPIANLVALAVIFQGCAEMFKAVSSQDI